METAPQPRRPLDLLPYSRDYSIIASLPKNSVSFAAAAEEAGVDAIMMNVDGDEESYAGQYGSYDLHDVYIKDVVSTVTVPCGIFIGGARPTTLEYWERVLSSQCGFVEMYAHQMPLQALADSRVKKIAAIGPGYILEQVKQISQMEGLEALDAAMTPAKARSAPFSLLDHATLGIVVGLSVRPVLLRTQKRLTHDDISRVMQLGVRGLVVDPLNLATAEEAYREELESLKPRRHKPDQHQERAGSDPGRRAGDETETLYLPAPKTDAPGGPEANP